MSFRTMPVTLDKSAKPFRRALQYAFYDWTRDMPIGRRIVATVGLLVQAAVLSGLLIAIKHPAIAVPLAVLFLIGLVLLNGALTSEFVRKMQLESDQIAAQQIQQTLQVQNPESPLGYDLQTFYKPFRDVGGDYFDVIALPHNRTLFAVADVSGKGVPAALLAFFKPQVNALSTAAPQISPTVKPSGKGSSGSTTYWAKPVIHAVPLSVGTTARYRPTCVSRTRQPVKIVPSIPSCGNASFNPSLPLA